MRILITGANGRLGGALLRSLCCTEHDPIGVSHAALDITHDECVRDMVQAVRPDAIINCAGYNAVDRAESDITTAYAVNAGGPAHLARAASAAGALLIHYSSDFVFDGRAATPYEEDAPVAPLNVYGASKLAGESEARSTPQHYILRVESLFGGHPVSAQATVDYIADSLVSGRRVRAFVDRTVTPSYAPDVVTATRRLLELQPAYGTYHCVNSGATTWYALALEIARQLGLDVPIEAGTVDQAKAAAARPRYCALSNRKLHAAGIPMPDWRHAVQRHLADRWIACDQPRVPVAHASRFTA